MLDPVILFICFVAQAVFVAAEPIQVSIPSTPPSRNIVGQNFLGISLELSFMDEYFGNDTSTIPPTVINYLSALRTRVGDNPLRLRIGGNSMDSSVYVPDQGSPMTQLIAGSANANNQPVNYGPFLWDVLDKVASDIGGAAYLIGLSLLDPNNTNVPVLAGAAQEKLGANLDGFLLGNEPDLYTSHLNRPNIANYTTSIYMDEFREVSNHLTSTSAGDILDKHNIGGPTICCSWNLDALLDDGYVSEFGNILKYVSLQHYPQNNCFGSYEYEIPYYVQHSNVVELAAWQESGISKALTTNRVIMSEFNSASCGGIPGISDTFAVGSLWTLDYALQLASVGYSAAYLHTRERGITYNLFAPPEGPNGNPGPWVTNPPFYALLVVAEALRSKNGSIVADLNIKGSMNNINATVGGYAVYDAASSIVQQLVLFNYANVSSSANSSETFVIPANVFSSTASKTVTIKYLMAQDMQEKSNIAWGGQTFANVGDGKLILANATWAPPNKQVDCSNGCSISVPAPGAAVVFAGGPPENKASSTNNTGGNSNTKIGNAQVRSATTLSVFFSVTTVLVLFTSSNW
ncbi:glycoside hydrolase family 79 protein [Crassisporium funariophilum]|nr:glycoside hydrolase family 79 protein [Crassisporium funariophilum]